MNMKDITQAAFWRTKSTETVRISAIARLLESGFSVRRWDGPGKTKPETRLRITGMNASMWKWSADSA